MGNMFTYTYTYSGILRFFNHFKSTHDNKTSDSSSSSISRNAISNFGSRMALYQVQVRVHIVLYYVV